MNHYHIKTVLFSTGERFPMLIDLNTGTPDYWSTVFSITRYRSRGQATNSIDQVLRQIMILKLFLERYSLEEIDLEKRLHQGKLLYLHEIESLCDICKLQIKEISDDTTKVTQPNKISKTVSLEKFRSSNSKKEILTVGLATSGNRIRVIRDFLVWMTDIHMTKLPEQDPTFLLLKEAKDFVKSTLTSRIPKISPTASTDDIPMGLSKETLDRLFVVANRSSADNPWKNNFTKIRNELIILWLYQFGIRRGELLSLKISDLDFKSETFTLVRRPNDPKDPRHVPARIKTKGRKIAIPKKIIRLTRDYIIYHRTYLPQAKKHEFLFVASKTGAAMSLDAVNKVFSKLKKTYPDTFKNLTPHLLRHSWNDKFSSLMDEGNVPEEKEKKMRAYLMGWSETSNSAETYTKRHVQRKANEAIIQMDNNFPKEEDLPDWAQ